MSNYKMLKDAFTIEKSRLFEKSSKLEIELNRLKRIQNTLSKIKKNDKANLDKVYRLKQYFPELEEMFVLFNKFINYDRSVKSAKKVTFDLDDFIRDVERCYELCGYPEKEAVDYMKRVITIICRNNMMNISNLSEEDRGIIAEYKQNGLRRIFINTEAICYEFSIVILEKIKEEMNKDDLDTEVMEEELEELKKRIALIDKYNARFSETELLTKFQSVEEWEEFSELVQSLLNNDECLELLNQVKIDQEKEEVEEIIITFDNLDMSSFSQEEQIIIEELREIIEDEELNGNIDAFDNIPITYEDRLVIYNNAPISHLLLDVKRNLLNKIYDNKEEIIKIFALIIKLYRKDTLFRLRVERMKELQRIRDDFISIINFINKTYVDKEKGYKKIEDIEEYIKSINEEYLPLIAELLHNDIDDESLDDEINLFIDKLKSEIKPWKKEMTEFYQDSKDEEDNKENTDNLVFCLTDDIDLSQEGLQKEFKGTVEALESKSSIELKKRSGRKGMSKIRKSTETNKEKDFIEYLENKYKVHLHFIPYRYSSDSNYRTGLIKFEPSQKVKSFLEEKYGLSKQSAYYGVFMVITSIGADHSEYSRFEEYILGNYREIEELAMLFTSENPDYEKLTMVVDKLLSFKKDKMAMINSDKQM